MSIMMVYHCCGNDILPEDSDYIQNNPCQHKICFLCFAKSTLKRGATEYCCQVKDCHQGHNIVSCQYFRRGIPGEIIENESIMVESGTELIAGDDDQSVNVALANLGVDEENESIMVELGVDQIACILSFLGPKDILRARVDKNWREAARKTIVPPVKFCVDSVEKYKAMILMATVLPNLQQITLGHLGEGHKWSDGEDPDEEEAAGTAHNTTHDIEIISNFNKLRILELGTAELNGRYPVLFNFPHLRELYLNTTSSDIKWDLEMLAGLPSLQRLECMCNDFLTGNINSLRVLKDTLEAVGIKCCYNVEGNFMDLADFPHLKELDLEETDVTGDIRDICEHEHENDFFPSLEILYLPAGVYGGTGYEFQQISEAHDLAKAVNRLKKQRPTLDVNVDWYGALSKDSLDWYGDEHGFPPLYIRLVEAGSRVGYRWQRLEVKGYPWPCEVTWLDPEPDRQSRDYEDYVTAMQELASQVGIYRGFYDPPTEEVYNKVWKKWKEEEEESDNESYDR